jgi:DNA helicase-2/ATP-dependent DNA helicase PcrA
VAQRALQLRDEGLDLGSMAVLYRSHFHALELQLELTRRNIPFSITSGIRFFEQAHIKDLAAYLKLVCNPRDELAFKRLVRLLPGIGGRTADKLWSQFTEACAASPLTTAGSAVKLAAVLQRCAASVPRKATAGWARLSTTMAQLEDESLRGQPAQLIRLALEADYEDYLKERYANYRARVEDLEQLASFARQFDSTDDFLGQLALLTNLEADEDRPVASDDERLRLSTIHQAKGLEFGVVFVIMLCDGLFPSSRSLETLEGEEEERRLFYVAVTRARNELYLSHPLLRGTHGGGDVLQQPSRFLRELPAALREEWNLRPYAPSF